MRAVYVTAIKSVLGMAVRDTYKGTEGKQGWKNHKDFHGRSTCPSSINTCKRNRSEQSSLAHYFNSVSHYVTSCNAWCFLKSATLSYACVLVTGFEIIGRFKQNSRARRRYCWQSNNTNFRRQKAHVNI